MEELLKTLAQVTTEFEQSHCEEHKKELAKIIMAKVYTLTNESEAYGIWRNELLYLKKPQDPSYIVLKYKDKYVSHKGIVDLEKTKQQNRNIKIAKVDIRDINCLGDIDILNSEQSEFIEEVIKKCPPEIIQSEFMRKVLNNLVLNLAQLYTI